MPSWFCLYHQRRCSNHGADACVRMPERWGNSKFRNEFQHLLVRVVEIKRMEFVFVWSFSTKNSTYDFLRKNNCLSSMIRFKWYQPPGNFVSNVNTYGISNLWPYILCDFRAQNSDKDQKRCRTTFPFLLNMIYSRDFQMANFESRRCAARMDNRILNNRNWNEI